MNSQGDELHPNWRALATIHLPLKRFIKAGEEALTAGAKNREGQKYAIAGVSCDEVKDFYESLVKEETSRSAIQHTKKIKVTNKTRRNIEEAKQEFDRSKFFRCAQANDFKSLRNFQLRGDEINACDQFGWTALMVAACEGALEAVQVLLNLGANRDVQDKIGKTALSLARQKSHFRIVELLENEEDHRMDDSLESFNVDEEESASSPFYCEICNRNFTETTLSSHQTSTVHQFNLKSALPPNKLQRFNISNRNRGLQLMVKQGWDQESGLGPSQSGRLYPVKTVIRKQRTGLGIEQQPARVTHFEAFDERAVRSNKSDFYKKKPRNRNDIRREKVREWKRDKRLRRELN